MQSRAANFTPGPWEVGKAYSRSKNDWYAVVFSPAKTGTFHTPRSAEALGVTREEADANARLIAAAPALLEALTEISGLVAAPSSSNLAVRLQVALDTLDKARTVARAALALAEPDGDELPNGRKA